jgi:hypothetical protein
VGKYWGMYGGKHRGKIRFANFSQQCCSRLLRVCGKKFFVGAGCGVWGFTDFEVVSYLIFREKVQEFYPRSLQWSAVFEVKKV